MKAVLVIFSFAIGIQGAMSENDVSGNDCFVPAVCSKDGFSETAWMSISRPVCEANITKKGAQGEVGRKGEMGEMGPVGLKGEDGPQGEVGQTGPRGDNGPRGEKGGKGEDGAVGPKGDKGPQGKAGQQGPHGENGTRGINGNKGEVGAKGDKGAQGGVGPKGEQASGDSLVIKNIIKALCPVKHENKCFLPVIGPTVDYNGGVAICESYGGYLANIYSQTNMDDIMKYIRENQIEVSGSKSFHLGMKYNPKAANKLTLRDGTDAPAVLKWRNGYPVTNAGYTAVILQVNKDQSTVWQYLANIYPSGTRSVLCEIE